MSTKIQTSSADTKTLHDLMALADIDSSLAEACQAYLDAFGETDLSKFEESYVGKYPSDIMFAQEMAEETGCIPKDMQWPLYCIDWELAADELMMDYTEQNGYFFRNF